MTILLLILVIFLVFLLINTIGGGGARQNHGGFHFKKILKRADATLIEDPATEALETIKQYIRNFDLAPFIIHVQNMYREVKLAYMNIDIERLSSLVSNELLTQIQHKITTLQHDNLRAVYNGIQFVNTQLTHAARLEDALIITIMLEIEQVYYVLNNTNTVVEGAPDVVKLLDPCVFVIDLKNPNTSMIQEMQL